MTEKRFTIRSYNGIGCHIFDGSIVIAEVHRADIKQLCDLLNALHEENEQLKKLNIPIEDVKEFVQDCKGRIIGVYYND